MRRDELPDVRSLVGCALGNVCGGPARIFSNTIAQTFTETPMTAPFIEDLQAHANIPSKIKLGQLRTPE